MKRALLAYSIFMAALYFVVLGLNVKLRKGENNYNVTRNLNFA